MTTPSGPPAGLLSIADAADRMGVKPWDVVRLIEAGSLPSVTLVPVASLPATRETK